MFDFSPQPSVIRVFFRKLPNSWTPCTHGIVYTSLGVYVVFAYFLQTQSQSATRQLSDEQHPASQELSEHPEFPQLQPIANSAAKANNVIVFFIKFILSTLVREPQTHGKHSQCGQPFFCSFFMLFWCWFFFIRVLYTENSEVPTKPCISRFEAFSMLLEYSSPASLATKSIYIGVKNGYTQGTGTRAPVGDNYPASRL